MTINLSSGNVVNCNKIRDKQQNCVIQIFTDVTSFNKPCVSYTRRFKPDQGQLVNELMLLIQGTAKIRICNHIQTKEVPTKTSAIPHSLKSFQKGQLQKTCRARLFKHWRKWVNKKLDTTAKFMSVFTSSKQSKKLIAQMTTSSLSLPLLQIPAMLETNKFLFIIDTGASLSIIPHSHVKSLSTEPTPVSLVMATGSDIHCYGQIKAKISLPTLQ